MKHLTELDGWSRVGGRRVSFVAEHSEVQALLAECLHAQEGPWALVGADLVDMGGRFVEVAWTWPNVHLSKCLDAAPERTQGLLWSRSFTPLLPDESNERFFTLCAWNGLIGVQRLGSPLPSGVSEFSIHMVDRVRSRDGSEERSYPEYRRVFERLRRRVRSLSVADSLRHGSVQDDTVRWLPGAVTAYEESPPSVKAPLTPAPARR